MKRKKEGILVETITLILPYKVMNLKIKKFVILVFIFFYSFILLRAEKYPGPLVPTEKRVQDLKSHLSKNKQDGTEINLFYKGKYSDYVIFYDLSGEEVFYKYRRNKFDKRAEKKIDSLVPGYAYKVKGLFSGMFVYKDNEKKKLNSIPTLVSKDKVEEEKILEKNNILVFIFLSAKPLFLEQLIY